MTTKEITIIVNRVENRSDLEENVVTGRSQYEAREKNPLGKVT